MSVPLLLTCAAVSRPDRLQDTLQLLEIRRRPGLVLGVTSRVQTLCKRRDELAVGFHGCHLIRAERSRTGRQGCDQIADGESTVVNLFEFVALDQRRQLLRQVCGRVFCELAGACRPLCAGPNYAQVVRC